jgi:alanyl-tRNA synthetase
LKAKGEELKVCQEKKEFLEKEVLELKRALAQRDEDSATMSSTTVEEKNLFLAQELEKAELQSLVDKIKEELYNLQCYNFQIDTGDYKAPYCLVLSITMLVHLFLTADILLSTLFPNTFRPYSFL